MVHDMKTPLSTIMMVQDMLESGRLDSKPEQTGDKEQIHEHSKKRGRSSVCSHQQDTDHLKAGKP